MTTEQAHNDVLNKLSQIYDNREAANITDWVLENITGLKRFDRNINKSAVLAKNKIVLLEKYLKELLLHKPVQYVLHEAWFYKMKFYVNEHVLIPRPETEELVEWVINDVRSIQHDGQLHQLRILDIGTGSGCIPISLKKEIKNIEVDSIDISEDALQVARRNVDKIGAEINFLKIDFLKETLWESLVTYDIIVSNPPYIPDNEKKDLAKNVAAFEPAIALFVPDNNPFIFYEKVAKFAQSHLNTNGHAYVEIHENYQKEIQQIFSACNFEVEIKKDMYGKYRMVKAWKL